MSCPFGETGLGKIGCRPPTSHELRATASATRPPNVISARNTRVVTAQVYRRPDSQPVDRIESRGDCGRSPKASIRRRHESKSVRRLSAVRTADGALRRPLPELRLQALAVERRGVCRLQGLA